MMRLGTAVKELRAHVGLKRKAFALALGVKSHATVFNWESGAGIDPFNLLRLIDYAKRTNAPASIIEALQAKEPELRP